MIPRRGGEFLSAQFNAATDNPPWMCSIYIAMFDEFDEGTAIAKAAPSRGKSPAS